MTPHEHMPAVSVVMVNWNGWRDCIECLDTVFAMSFEGPIHVVIVDNDSADGSIEHILNWCAEPVWQPEWQDFEGVLHRSLTPGAAMQPISVRVIDAQERLPHRGDMTHQLTLVRSGGNLGFAGGNNVGLRALEGAGFAYHWLLNTDTVVHHQALTQLVERAMRDKRIGMVGSTLRYYWNPGFVQAMCGGELLPQNTLVRLLGADEPVAAVPSNPTGLEKQLHYVMGASMLISADFLAEVGPMEEDYFLYYEELDWALRARGRHGLAYAPASHVFHKVGGSSSQVVSTFAMNLMYRNKIKFMARYLPHLLSRTLFFLAHEMARHVGRGRWLQAKLIARSLLDARRLIRQGVQGRKV